MAFDILAGKQGGRSWSRGTDDWYPPNAWLRRAAVSQVAKIPITPIIVGVSAVTVSAIFLALSGSKPKKKPYRRRITEPTVQIPREMMSEINVHGKRKT